MPARLRLILSILAVLVVLFVGAAGYMIVEMEHHPSFLDALYMMVITISTVGYGEVFPLSHGGQLWTIVVITFGIVTVSYAFTSLLTLVVGGELRFLRERKKMDKAIEHLSGHVIMCGYGRMGALVIRELRERGIPVVVVEKERTLEPDLRDAQVPFVIGDATEEDTLLQAGLKRASALVIVLRSDADNVYITLTAHTLCPNLVIVARAEQPTTEAKLTRAGATRVVCPQVIGATKVANILTRPTVVDFVEVANKGVDLELDEYEVSDQSPLVGRSLRDSHVRRKTGAIVIAIKRADGEALVNPDPDAHLEAKDTLILVGPAGVSSRLDKIEHEG